jgi:hypothetical protein
MFDPTSAMRYTVFTTWPRCFAVRVKNGVQMKTIFVDCLRDQKIIASYPLSWGITIGPSSPPSRNQLIDEAKTNLVSERLAKPPFDGIEFRIRDP